jgi:hypothetical protein
VTRWMTADVMPSPKGDRTGRVDRVASGSHGSRCRAGRWRDGIVTLDTDSSQVHVTQIPGACGNWPAIRAARPSAFHALAVAVTKGSSRFSPVSPESPSIRRHRARSGCPDHSAPPQLPVGSLRWPPEAL